MTLKKFIKKVNINEHYRIYQSNKDCLIFESYFKIHSPYKFENEDYEFNNKYYDENDYCDNVYKRKLDKETKIFLKKFGKYEITHLECGIFREFDLPCFNVFIVPKVKERGKYDKKRN